MSPVLSTQSLSSAPVAAPYSSDSSLPFIPKWSNPIPGFFSELDGRQHILQARNNRFLEMHPNGTRGVEHTTEYCLLTILIVNISALGSYNKSAEALKGWTNSNSDKGINFGHAQDKPPRHVIRGVKDKNYLCMDDKSVIYQTPNFNQSHCVFNHELTSDHFDQYYRHLNNSGRKWYIGINRDGSIRCGNRTRANHPGSNFSNAPHGENKTSPPFISGKRPCCPKKQCKNEKRRKKPRKNKKPVDSGLIEPTDSRKTPGSRDKCNKHTNWCRKKRRQFFQLKLKDLKRYYNRCIKEKIRHCKNR